MEWKYWMVFVTALIPLVIGAIWYNPKVMGESWRKSAGLTKEQTESGNMAMIFGFTYLFGILLSLLLVGLTIHQSAFDSLLRFVDGFNEPNSEVRMLFDQVMTKYGDHHRSFGHGALHGGMAAILFVLPVLGMAALFERRGWKYIFTHVGYWFITLALMGGVLCQFA